MQHCQHCQAPLSPSDIYPSGLCRYCGNLTIENKPLTTLTIDPEHIKNAMLDLCENWERVADEYREMASKSITANGKRNPDVCRAIAVGLEQCARDVKKVIGDR